MTTMNWTARLAGGAGAVAVVAAVALGGNYLWKRQFGPTIASKADCTLAQQLFDQARTPPADPKQAETWESQIRRVRYTKMRDEGLSTQVGYYAHWSTVQATGVGQKPTPKQFAEMLDQAKGHCRESGVTLVIPALHS